MLQIYVFIFGFIKPREHQHSCAIASSPPCQHFLGLSGFSVHFLLLPLLAALDFFGNGNLRARTEHLGYCTFLLTSFFHGTQNSERIVKCSKRVFIFTFLSRRWFPPRWAEVFINAAFTFGGILFSSFVHRRLKERVFAFLFSFCVRGHCAKCCLRLGTISKSWNFPSSYLQRRCIQLRW